MVGPGEFRRVCRACGRAEELERERCSACGADLNAMAAPPDNGFVDENPALRHVDPNNRVELDRFNRRDEAELACGLLRFHRIPCELSSMVIPGLPADTILWVHAEDAELAWALLADMERQAFGKDKDVA